MESLAAAVDALEDEAAQRAAEPPRRLSPAGRSEYHHNAERGYNVTGARERGNTLIIEDFFNADPAFDFLVNHARTMSYNKRHRPGAGDDQQLRNPYPLPRQPDRERTWAGRVSAKHKYAYNQAGFNCMMVRMIYFVHDVGPEDGPFSVVPATHKSNMASPYNGRNPDEEPGMIGLPVQAGDGILFTENLRHGGLTNRGDMTRKTIHIGYGPFWMKSQNIATMDDDQYILPLTLRRYSPEQRQLFTAWPDCALAEFRGDQKGSFGHAYSRQS